MDVCYCRFTTNLGESVDSDPDSILCLISLPPHKNQQMSAEARMFLILIQIFSNSHPSHTPKTCLKCFSWPNLECSILKCHIRHSFWKNFRPNLSLDVLTKWYTLNFRRGSVFLIFCRFELDVLKFYYL